METISIPTNKGINYLCFENIIRIQSFSNYSKIYFADDTYPLTVAKVLHWFEENLPAHVFIRTHRSHLVNRHYIKRIILSTHAMQLSNGEQVGISKRRKQWIRQRLCA